MNPEQLSSTTQEGPDVTSNTLTWLSHIYTKPVHFHTSREHAALDLKAVSSNPKMGTEVTLKKKKSN